MELYIFMNLDLGNFKSVEKSRKGSNYKTIGDNPLISRMDYDQISINDLSGGELFTGKVQVPRVLNKEDKSYNTAIVEIFNDEDKEKLALFVNFDSRKEEINVNDGFEFYIDFFNLVKSLAIMQDKSNEDKNSFVNVNTLKFLIALDTLDEVTVMAVEKDNGYNTFVFVDDMD